MAAVEKQVIADALARNHYHIAQTADTLQLPLRTLQRKIRHYRLRKKDFKNAQ